MELQAIKERLKAARSPVALTGAGISAESGVPTFRGPDGLWRNFRPEDLATPEAFERDPALVWEWYDWRRSLIAGIRPNPAHYALAEFERRNPAFTLITQNVDGLHRSAGSGNIIEIHGSIWTVRCIECGNSSENRDVPIKILPRCGCGGLLRPGVVWFGEALPEDLLYRSFEAASSADIMLVVGTSGVVQPAASFATRAKDAGAFVIEINPETTPLSGRVDAVIQGRAGEMLPRLIG
ncbi:MAG: NAD-dependent deacylase [Deltaproteobacteria bacterium]|nr:NAD-dependent deacylase [Deltaproteobacteria bacterium]MCL4874826.1 NAD-dependent deacylase [bacterium]